LFKNNTRLEREEPEELSQDAMYKITFKSNQSLSELSEIENPKDVTVLTQKIIYDGLYQ